MGHGSALIANLVVAFVFAFALGFVASKLRLPPLVGYLLAGIAVGPYTPGFVANSDLAGQLAEVGVILLMFGVGVHFSLRDLASVHAVAIPGALAQMVVAVAACVGLAGLFGWDLSTGVLLGLALSVASTVVLLRIMEERNQLDTVDGRIAVGWLIVQDIVMVLVLVLLPPLAQGDVEEGLPWITTDLAETIAITLGKLAAFLALVLIVGRRVVPWLLDQVARTGSRELFTLSVLAVALGVAFGSAELFGVSFALGAFFAGVVLSESDMSHQAAADSLPLRDAFAVLFFVSVGMLFDPSILVREPLAVLAVLLVITLVKGAAAILVVLALRYALATAITVAVGLAQIGEFSFILGALGFSLGVLSADGLDLILAGSLLTITLNPLLFVGAERLTDWLDARPHLRARVERIGEPPPAAPAGEHEWRDHAVIVGYGRVGSTIGRALDRHGMRYIVVERDRRRVEELRGKGLTVVWGDAGAAAVMEAAHVGTARLVVLALPNALQARQALQVARHMNPRVAVVARAHREADILYLERQGVDMVVMGERELALEMIAFALQSLGMPGEEAQVAVRSLRTSGAGEEAGTGTTAGPGEAR